MLNGTMCARINPFGRASKVESHSCSRYNIHYQLGTTVTITRLYLDNDGVPLSVTFKMK